MSPEGWALILTVGIASALGPPPHHTDEGSLRSALDAVTRKQRSLDVSPQEYYNDLHSYRYQGDRARQRDRDDDLEFLPFENGQLETIGEGYQKSLPNGHWADEVNDNNLNNKLLERVLMDYLENEPDQGDPVSSAFRERERSGGHKRGANTARPNVSNKQLAKLFLEELQDGPPSDQGEVEDEEYMATLQSLYNKYRNEQENKAHGYDVFNAPMSWSGTFGKQDSAKDQDQDLLYLVPAERRNVNARYPLGKEYKDYGELRKRYPVAKRSPKPMHRKRQVTDPKVAQDLGNLFGKQSADKHDHSHDPDHDHSHHSHDHNRDDDHEHDTGMPYTTAQPKGQKENATKVDKPKDHPIEVKKKSVDWSQYFGIDRRKKKASLLARPGTKDQDDDWLLQQYYKTMAENLKPSATDKEGGEKRDKLQQMDSRLKSIEDLIVEEALRYTGSRDGANLQEVKDKVMARLAAAYSLEKMRRALNEFKSNVAAQRQAQKLAASQNNLTTDLPNGANDDKRNDNSIIGNEGADEGLNCPEIEAVERRCKAVDILVGDRAQLLYPPCVMHQICRACIQEDEECDKSFASEAARVCNGNMACFRAARDAQITLSQLQPPQGTLDLCHESPCLTRSAHYMLKR